MSGVIYDVAPAALDLLLLKVQIYVGIFWLFLKIICCGGEESRWLLSRFCVQGCHHYGGWVFLACVDLELETLCVMREKELLTNWGSLINFVGRKKRHRTANLIFESGAVDKNWNVEWFLLLLRFIFGANFNFKRSDKVYCHFWYRKKDIVVEMSVLCRKTIC